MKMDKVAGSGKDFYERQPKHSEKCGKTRNRNKFCRRLDKRVMTCYNKEVV